jgi:hypothetical protein
MRKSAAGKARARRNRCSTPLKVRFRLEVGLQYQERARRALISADNLLPIHDI